MGEAGARVDECVSDFDAAQNTDLRSPDETSHSAGSFAKKAADIPLSILDLAQVGSHESVGDAIRSSVELAQRAEATGRFERIWFAEHHNMKNIASAATSVLLAHVASQTQTIRVGSGGVMLPNHSPLTIAEQFGTLAELHPGRIDLGKTEISVAEGSSSSRGALALRLRWRASVVASASW